MTPSYTVTTVSTRTNGPTVSTQYPVGCFIQDHAYSAGSGDLDERNGRFCVTPEYPNGTYAYFVTIDASLNPISPYTFYGTYYGVVQTGNTGMKSGHVTISEPTTVYTPTAVGVSQPKNDKIKFQFMPNPVQDYAFIYMDVNSKNNVKGSLYNSKGQLLQTLDFMQPSIAYTIDMTSYAAGIYFLTLEADGEKISQKIVKSVK